ncbi:MAG: hypothetical protein IJ094_01860 [Bacilli bacterium]|nr:hypothetical protein [Bacilli bacterium]
MKKLNKSVIIKGASLVAASIVLTTPLVGCSKSTVLEDTKLEETQVMYYDDNALIVKQFQPHNRMSGEYYCDTGRHYTDVVTGVCYHVAEKKEVPIKKDDKVIGKEEKYLPCENSAYVYLEDEDVRTHAITNLLEKDELEKAANNKFSDKDLIEIQNRLTEEVKKNSRG